MTTSGSLQMLLLPESIAFRAQTANGYLDLKRKSRQRAENTHPLSQGEPDQ